MLTSKVSKYCTRKPKHLVKYICITGAYLRRILQLERWADVRRNGDDEAVRLVAHHGPVKKDEVSCKAQGGCVVRTARGQLGSA